MLINRVSCEVAEAAALWGVEEFGTAKLGNALRTDRLVAIGARAVLQPHGLITSVFARGAQREGCYRFMENPNVLPSAITTAAARGCLRRMRGEQIVVAPIDGSSLSYLDPEGRRDMGSIGPRSKKGRGIKVLTTIATTMDGVPLGLLGQTFWRRSLLRNPVHHQNRPFATRETSNWVEQMGRITRLSVDEQTQSIIWFNGDSEADFKEALEFGVNAPPNVWLTVRNAANRRVVKEADDDCLKLWDAVGKLPRRGRYKLDVPPGEGRSQRTASMHVRAGYVTLLLRKRSSNNSGDKQPVRVGVVWAVEKGTTPKGEEPIEWLLLTTAPVDTVDDVLRVIHAYSLRWRVEDFHKAWKTGCKIEESQLEDITNVMRWAAIMASVAIRIERLKHLGRNHPELPAKTEFAAEEIEAARLLADPQTVDRNVEPTMDTMVKWVAQIGGYVSYRGRPPPGTKVLTRGYLRLQVVAEALRAQSARRQT